MRIALAIVALLVALPALAGCFFLPFTPDADHGPQDTGQIGSDPDWDDDGDGFTENQGDCNDDDETVHPGAEDVANEVDDDCDGDVDEPPDPVDADGDGWPADDGDCDDNDPTVHPNTVDGCDDVDNDCDGELNEDVVSEDPQEPNDEAPNYVGDLTNANSAIAGYLHNEQDVDRFSFYVDDGWLGDFWVDVQLTGVPGSADYVLELWLDGGVVGYSDTSGAEGIHFDGDSWEDDSGTYEVRVYSVMGFSCTQAYVLEMEGSG